MNNDSDPNGEPETPARPVSAEEFDALFDAGEDVSAYVQWDKGVMVAPGELSPGQKESLLAVLGELSSNDKVVMIQAMLDAVAGTELNLNVPIPAALHIELVREALKRQTTREALVQSWIVQRLEGQRVAA